MGIQKDDELLFIRDRKNDKEWYFTDNLLIDFMAEHIGVYASLVYVSLCRYANNNKKQQTFISLKTVCQKLDISKNMAIRSIKVLEFFNMIHKERRGQRKNNTYTLINRKYWAKDCDRNILYKIMHRKNKSL